MNEDFRDQSEQKDNKPKTKYIKLLITAVVLAILGIIFLFIALEIDSMFGILSFLLFLASIIVFYSLFIKLLKRKAKYPKQHIATTALSFEILAAACYGIGCIRSPLSVLFIVFAVILPIAGLITGICALAEGKKNLGTAGLVTAITAVLLPIIFVAIMIILLSTRVIVISLM